MYTVKHGIIRTVPELYYNNLFFSNVILIRVYPNMVRIVLPDISICIGRSVPSYSAMYKCLNYDAEKTYFFLVYLLSET